MNNNSVLPTGIIQLEFGFDYVSTIHTQRCMMWMLQHHYAFVATVVLLNQSWKHSMGDWIISDFYSMLLRNHNVIDFCKWNIKLDDIYLYPLLYSINLTQCALSLEKKSYANYVRVVGTRL